MGKVYLTHRFYSFKIDFSKDLAQNLDDFTRMTSDPDDIEHKVKDETQAIMLLNYLTLDLVVYSLRAKDLEIKVFDKGNSSDSLIVKGRTEKRDRSYRGKSKNRSKSRNKKNVRCHFYKKKQCHYRSEGHIRKGKNYDKSKSSNDSDSYLVSEGYESFEVLVVNSNRCETNWVFVFGCSYHMSPFRHHFSDLNKFYGGRVFLGDKYEC